MMITTENEDGMCFGFSTFWAQILVLDVTFSNSLSVGRDLSNSSDKDDTP
jgi:hypothetical protein